MLPASAPAHLVGRIARVGRVARGLSPVLRVVLFSAAALLAYAMLSAFDDASASARDGVAGRHAGHGFLADNLIRRDAVLPVVKILPVAGRRAGADPSADPSRVGSADEWADRLRRIEGRLRVGSGNRVGLGERISRREPPRPAVPDRRDTVGDPRPAVSDPGDTDGDSRGTDGDPPGAPRSVVDVVRSLRPAGPSGSGGPTRPARQPAPVWSAPTRPVSSALPRVVQVVPDLLGAVADLGRLVPDLVGLIPDVIGAVPDAVSGVVRLIPGAVKTLPELIPPVLTMPRPPGSPVKLASVAAASTPDTPPGLSPQVVEHVSGAHRASETGLVPRDALTIARMAPVVHGATSGAPAAPDNSPTSSPAMGAQQSGGTGTGVGQPHGVTATATTAAGYHLLFTARARHTDGSGRSPGAKTLPG